MHRWKIECWQHEKMSLTWKPAYKDRVLPSSFLKHRAVCTYVCNTHRWCWWQVSLVKQICSFHPRFGGYIKKSLQYLRLESPCWPVFILPLYIEAYSFFAWWKKEFCMNTSKSKFHIVLIFIMKWVFLGFYYVTRAFVIWYRRQRMFWLKGI